MDIDSSTIIWEPVIDLSPIPIRVYPNPTTSWVSVELPEGQLQYWELLDIQGKRVQGGTYMPDHTLWLNELPAGVYLLQAVVDEQRYQARITKE
ncbi:MAG: T9SS type A sorting domain-containing protein [Chitinophagales bacterium]|nr:T9SS type A sorting domain-containing protein [Chitinophagales bacterium]